MEGGRALRLLSLIPAAGAGATATATAAATATTPRARTAWTIPSIAGEGRRERGKEEGREG